MTLAQTERAALADLLDELGPDKPTLCEGWRTKELLTHLLIRERRADATIAAMIPPAREWTKRVARGYLTDGWADAVQTFRSGPQAWNPLRWEKVDQLFNGMEYFIHHEDARRGEPGWKPRELSPQDTATLTHFIGTSTVRLAFRKLGVGVVADLPDGSRVKLRDGSPTAVVSGGPGEVLIWSSGRSAVQLEFGGDPEAVAALRRSGFDVDDVD